jgi:RNA polymerase sigma factor (sigma-70 family)
VLTIAHRKAIDAHRARRRRPDPVESLDEHAAQAPSPDGDPDLWRAVRALPPKQRAAVVLRYVGGFRHAEAATVLGCSEEAARRNLHAGLTKLRKEWIP